MDYAQDFGAATDWLLETLLPYRYTIIFLAFFVIFLAISHANNRDLPPGPTGLPYFGYWYYLSDQNCIETLDKLRHKYGDFYSFTSTGSLFISLGSHRAVREAHVTKSDCFEGRFTEYGLLTAVFADGIGFLNGEAHKVLRKYFVQVFRERGMLSIKDHVSSSIYDSIRATVDELKTKKDDEPIDILTMLTDRCTSVIRLTLFGEDGVTEEQVREINALYEGIIEYQTSVNLLLVGNFTRYFCLPLASWYRKFKRCQHQVEKLLFEIIEEHKVTYDEENLRDMIDEYIKERNDRQNKGDPSHKYFTDKALVSTLLQIVGDGVLSVSAFVALFIKILLDHPEEQDKIYQEIVEVVGLERLPKAEDKGKLVYANAFLNEGLRTSDFFPFFPSMQCTKETTIRGYRIPEGTITLLNLWSAHNDPEVYDEPQKFDPSRFLVKDESKRPELPINFGVGKRACVGEGYVMLQIFLFLTSLVQNFRLSMANDEKRNTTELLFSGKLRILVQPRK